VVVVLMLLVLAGLGLTGHRGVGRRDGPCSHLAASQLSSLHGWRGENGRGKKELELRGARAARFVTGLVVLLCHP